MGKRLSKETRLTIVKEALAGIKVGVLARMYGIHPETIRLWIRDHGSATLSWTEKIRACRIKLLY